VAAACASYARSSVAADRATDIVTDVVTDVVVGGVREARVSGRGGRASMWPSSASGKRGDGAGHRG
jgi:hypothetical protein